MNQTEHLLTIAQEECCETGQRLAKAARFGMQQIYTSHPDGLMLTNEERILLEFTDLCVTLYRLGIIDIRWLYAYHSPLTNERIQEKLDKIERYMSKAEGLGTLERQP